MLCFRNKHVVIDDESINPPNVLAVESRVARQPSKIPVRIVQSADSGLSSSPPLVNAPNDGVNGRVSVIPEAAKKAVKHHKVNFTPCNPPKAKRAWNGSIEVPESLQQVLPMPAEQTTGARPDSATHTAAVCDHLRVPITPPKPVGTGIGRRSSSGSLIPVRIPASRFSSSTFNDAPLKETGKNKAFFKPVKTFFKRISRALSGQDKKEKKAVMDALSAPSEIVPAKAQPTGVEIRIDEEVVARTGDQVIGETCNVPSIEQDQAPTRVSAYREAILDNLICKRHTETSGTRAKRRTQVEVDICSPLDHVAPIFNNPAYHCPTTVPEPPSIQRDSTFSVSTSTSSSSDIKVPTNAELQAMANALSAINQRATQGDCTTRRRTTYFVPAVAQKVATQMNSPSSSSTCSTFIAPTDSQLQAMDTLLSANEASNGPAPGRRQFSRRAPTVEASAATGDLPVSVPQLTLEDTRLQVLLNTTAQEPVASTVRNEERAAVAIGTSPDAVEGEHDASTPSSDIEVPSNSQLDLLESLLCGSDRAPSFSDSGIAFIEPCLPETKVAGPISRSSSDFLVPTDSQIQLMEELLCGKAMSVNLVLPTGLSKLASMYKQAGKAVGASYSNLDIPGKTGIQVVADDHASDVSIPLAYGAKCAECVSGESSDVVATDADLKVMEDLLCGPDAAAESSDSGANFSPTHGSEIGSETSSEIMAPTDAEIHAMELALVSWCGSSSSSTESESNSDTNSSSDSANSSPLLGRIEQAMLSSAGRAATARRSVNRNTRQIGDYNAQPKRSALRKEPDIIEVDRATGLPVKSDWREVHFPEKELGQVAFISREPATVDMNYIVPDPDPVQMTADKVFLNTPCLLPRTDVPGMRLDRVFPILNITSPRPDNTPPAPYRSAPADRRGSLLPESKVESPPEDAPRRSPWADHNRFFDYEARVKGDPYTLGQHKELVLWRNRHRFGRRTSVYLPGIPFIIRDSKNVLKRASRALEDHICKLGLNKPRELPIQMPVRTAMVHNAHFLRHTEAEDCPCGKSRKLRYLDNWFKPTNVSAYAITEASHYAEDDLRDPDTDSGSDSGDPNTNTPSGPRRRARSSRAADSLLMCGAYRARQLAHPLVTEYSRLYDLHPRRIYIPSVSNSKTSGFVSVPSPGSVSFSRLDNVPLPLNLSCSEPKVPHLIVTSPSSLSPSVSASSGNSMVSELHPTRPWILSEQHSGLRVSCSVYSSVASSSGVCAMAVPPKASFIGRPVIPSSGVSAEMHANHLNIASQKVSRESLHRIIELSSDVLQEPRPSGGPDVSSALPLHSATSGFARRPEPSGNTSELASNAASMSSKPADTLCISATTCSGPQSVPFIRAVTSRALLLPKPSLNDLNHLRL